MKMKVDKFGVMHALPRLPWDTLSGLGRKVNGAMVASALNNMRTIAIHRLMAKPQTARRQIGFHGVLGDPAGPASSATAYLAQQTTKDSASSGLEKKCDAQFKVVFDAILRLMARPSPNAARSGFWSSFVRLDKTALPL